MNIKKTWGEINDPADQDLSALLQTTTLSKFSSHSPLEKIKKNLLINMIWTLLICLIYVAIIFYFQIWQVQICIGLVLLISLWALYSAYQQYKHINSGIPEGNTVLDELKRHYQSITDWIYIQQRVALLVYPLSAAGGFMLGGVLGSGKPVEVFMHKPDMLAAMLISILILIPLCWFLAKWMSNHSFCKHLKTLKNNIDALEEEK